MTPGFDVIVTGGGPAGSVVALTLAQRGRRVGLLEASCFEERRYGETLPPEITPVLRRAGLWPAFEELRPLESPGMVASWGSHHLETDFIDNPYGSGWHVERTQFDAMLWHQAQSAGVTVMGGYKVRSCEQVGGEWQVAGTSRQSFRLRARFLVDASGPNGLRCGDTFGRRRGDTMVAIVFEFASGVRIADTRAYVESAPQGWWYSAPLPRGGLTCMFFTDRETYRLDGVVPGEQLGHCPLTRTRFCCGKIVGYRVVPARSTICQRISGSHAVAAGDSASSYDPISGMGVLKAVRHGMLAGAAVDAALSGNTSLLAEYAQQVHDEYGIYCKERQRYYAAERRWDNERFWMNRRAVRKPAPETAP